MTVKSDTKFKEKLTCGFKYNMRNLVNFHPTAQKSENSTSMGFFCPKHIMFQLENFWGIIVITLTGDAKFKGKLSRGLKNDITNYVTFHASSRKSHFYGLLLSKEYKDLNENVQLCLMTLKSDAKFEEKWILGSKNDMRHSVNFNVNSGKSENLHFGELLLSIA